MKPQITELRKLVRRVLRENENFFYEAPIKVGSVNNTRLNSGAMEIDFATDRHVPMTMKCPMSSWSEFTKHNPGDGGLGHVKSFLVAFLDGATPEAEPEEAETLEEIIDDDGNIMDDQDTPSNATNSGVGSSTSDSNRTLPQTFGKSRTYTGNLGRGVVVW